MSYGGGIGALRASLAIVVASASLAVGCGADPARPRQVLDADPPLEGPAALEASLASTEVQRGVTYLENGRFEEARVHLEKALTMSPGHAEASFYLGVARERSGDRAGAEQAYKQALAAKPALVEATLNLAALYLDDPSRPDDAIALLKSGLERTAGEPQLLANLGYAQGLRGDLAAASKAYEASLASADDPTVRLAYGTLLFQSKELERAAAELRKALAKTGDDAALLATIARMLGPAKDFAGCVAALDRAVKLKPDPELHVRRGTCRHELNDEAGARADYEEAIKLDEKFTAAHYYLGISYFFDRKPQSAKRELERVVELDPKGPFGKLATERLRGFPKGR
jgi:Flp pilus assembly protein TadD